MFFHRPKMILFASLSALRFLVSFLLIIIPLVLSLSFNFNSFNPNDPNMTYDGDATSGGGVIQLTSNQRDHRLNSSIGRATYSEPLHLWDKATGNVTDFTTQFSFSINSQGGIAYGYGLAFFLEPVGSRIPDNTTGIAGGSLGLTGNRFVAVEFDTFKDSYDPQGDHVGIDINSMQSVVNVTWFSSIPDGKRNNVSISYNSTSRNLSVLFTGFSNDSAFLQNLSYNLDLREYLPEWVTFGFTGATGEAVAIQSIFSWSLTSSLDINPLGPAPNPSPGHINPAVPVPSPDPDPTPRKNKLGLVVGLISGGCVLVALCVLLFAFWRKRKAREDKDDDDDVFDGTMSHEFERSTGPKKFLYSELAKCTNKFAREEKLGEGGFGGVYKGYVRELDAFVAVKRVSRQSKQGIKEYASEVRIISRLRHRHLVKLIGWCHEKRELLLVYEFMPNGSLDSHLFKGKNHLTWPIRYKIAQGLASALMYLHEEWEQCVLHRDIKPSNIMLDSDFNAKLGDFGLARLVDHGKGSQTTVLAGTMGYMAPECVTTGRVSKETDVYSFGIVMLEIGCGRKPNDTNAEEHNVNIVDWVWRLYGIGELHKAADPRLSSEFDEQEMEHLLIVGLWCAHPDSNCRPSIRQAIHVLNFEAPLPALPPNMPVAKFCIPSRDLPTASLPSSSSHYTDSSKSTASSSAASLTSVSLLYPR